MEWVWLVVFVILLLIEATTVNFITIWFAVGSLGAFITTYLTDNTLIQCLVFVVITTIALIVTRPLVKKLSKGKPHIKTNLDSVVGEVGIVDETIKPTAMGRVNVLGKNWAAKSDKMIKVGSKVRILAIDGVKLIVQKEEEE